MFGSFETDYTSLLSKTYPDRHNDPYHAGYKAHINSLEGSYSVSWIEEANFGIIDQTRIEPHTFMNLYSHPCLLGIMTCDEQTGAITLDKGAALLFREKHISGHSYHENNIIVNVPQYSEKPEDFYLLTACYYKIFCLIGHCNHNVDRTYGICIPPLGIRYHNWSKTLTGQAASRAFNAYAANAVGAPLLISQTDQATRDAYQRHLNQYIKESFQFLGYEHDTELKPTTPVSTNVAPFTLAIDRPNQTYLADFRRQLLRAHAKFNRAANGESYAIAALCAKTNIREQHPLLLENQQESQSSIIQGRPAQSQTLIYAQLYADLGDLLEGTSERKIVEFSGFNAEELMIRREDATTIQIIVSFNLQAHTNQFLLFGVQRTDTTSQPATIITLSDDGTMTSQFQHLIPTNKRLNIDKYSSMSASEWQETIPTHLRNHVESICQLFIEHCHVGTFALTKTGNPVTMLNQVYLALLASNALDLEKESSFTNAIILSQDSEFKIRRTPLKKASCQQLGLTNGTEFTFNKQTQSSGGGRGGSYQVANRDCVLQCGHNIDGQTVISLKIIKSDYQRGLSDQSSTQIQNASLKLTIDPDGTYTSQYTRGEHTINFDGFLMNFGLSPLTIQSVERQEHGTGRSLSELTSDETKDVAYTFRIMLNNLALLRSDKTHVDGIRHIDGRLLSDQEMIETIVCVRQNPMQAGTWQKTMSSIVGIFRSDGGFNPEHLLAYMYFTNSLALSALADQTQPRPYSKRNPLPRLALPAPEGFSGVQNGVATHHQRQSTPCSSALFIQIACVSLLTAALATLLLTAAAPAVILSAGLTLKTVQSAAAATMMLSAIGLFAARVFNQNDTAAHAIIPIPT